MNKIKAFLASFFQGTSVTFLSLFIWELLEEALEEAIAIGITSIITKAISTLFVVGLTQGIKVFIKRFIKAMTYKEGDDKVKVIKNIFQFLWGNKLTATLISFSAYTGFLTYEISFFNSVIANIGLSIAVAIVMSIISVRVGFETLSQIVERFAKKKLSDEEIKEAKRKAKETEEKARKIQEIYAKLQEEEKIKRELQLKEQAERLVNEQYQV